MLIGDEEKKGGAVEEYINEDHNLLTLQNKGNFVPKLNQNITLKETISKSSPNCIQEADQEDELKIQSENLHGIDHNNYKLQPSVVSQHVEQQLYDLSSITKSSSQYSEADNCSTISRSILIPGNIQTDPDYDLRDPFGVKSFVKEYQRNLSDGLLIKQNDNSHKQVIPSEYDQTQLNRHKEQLINYKNSEPVHFQPLDLTESFLKNQNNGINVYQELNVEIVKRDAVENISLYTDDEDAGHVGIFSAEIQELPLDSDCIVRTRGETFLNFKDQSHSKPIIHESITTSDDVIHIDALQLSSNVAVNEHPNIQPISQSEINSKEKVTCIVFPEGTEVDPNNGLHSSQDLNPSVDLKLNAAPNYSDKIIKHDALDLKIENLKTTYKKQKEKASDKICTPDAERAINTQLQTPENITVSLCRRSERKRKATCSRPTEYKKLKNFKPRTPKTVSCPTIHLVADIKKSESLSHQVANMKVKEELSKQHQNQKLQQKTCTVSSNQSGKLVSFISGKRINIKAEINSKKVSKNSEPVLPNMEHLQNPLHKLEMAKSTDEKDVNGKKTYYIKCKLCLQVFRDTLECKVHSNNHHNGQVTAAWACRHCPQMYSRKFGFHRLLMRDHSNEKFERIVCRYCGKMFPSDCRIKRHIRIKHKTEVLP